MNRTVGHQANFYVSHQGKQWGPLGISEILQCLRQGELTMTDFVFDEEANDWVLIVDYAPFKQELQQLKPQQKPPLKLVSTPPVEADTGVPLNAPSGGSQEGSRDWYVLKGENKFGPFGYLDLLKMLQEKTIFEFDLVWNPGLSGWKRVAEVPDFQAQRIQELRKGASRSLREVFSLRRHPRVKMGASALIHDNNSIWKGEVVEISVGGMGILIENALIAPGQTLLVHVKSSERLPAFNVNCEVVSKQYLKEIRSRTAEIRYNLKFKGLSQQVQSLLEVFLGQEGKSKAA